MNTTTSRLSELAQRRRGPVQPVEEQCDLCAEPIGAEHRHLLDLQTRRLLCACRACTILFDRSGAGGRHYSLIGDRIRAVQDLELDDTAWRSFDPCLPCGVHMYLGKGKTIKRVHSPMFGVNGSY